MIEVKALTAFTDKETGVFHKLEDLFSCSEKRAKELSDLGAVEVIKVDAPTKKTRKKV